MISLPVNGKKCYQNMQSKLSVHQRNEQKNNNIDKYIFHFGLTLEQKSFFVTHSSAISEIENLLILATNHI